ncbi:YaiO family outer membrane beta-barrel protein [Croceitalea rosinachiae]|uniref:YaiO family outer membrane beta-barrel protein n=1 Tax=Croceitalea rosinachiae TaxID=3075596 RepID=A0ABU3ABH3_9FLAO|nr:YaiO family outer membrane beta-barrel protein [Croceitalea sp. F388]MDT0607537.1 YaiO family outer membrane beta-barrel protein [Croceitalea sp. F388]
MRYNKQTYLLIFLIVIGAEVFSQDLASINFEDDNYEEAYELAYDGKYNSAKKILEENPSITSENLDALFLLASTYSWNGQYDKARSEFNKILSQDKTKRGVWISAIKNELYAKTNSIALGLANKAIIYIENDEELQRLMGLALEGISNIKYAEKGWHNVETNLKSSKASKKQLKSGPKKVSKKIEAPKKEEGKTEEENVEPKNRIGVNNAFTVFNERYDPVIFSSVSFRRQTKIGALIPKINYSNRNGVHGLQYDIDFYPKFLKRFYAYLNYGYSNASIYPSQKFGGDIYMNLPNAIEFSAGGRYLSTTTQTVKAITNSLGYYKGNYYYSLRSFISPREGSLWSISGNLLVRKYLKDAENFMGVSIGMGFSPELQQLIVGDDLLSETVLYVESQRLSIQYQFTTKKSPNIYRANLGVRRQELAFDSNNFFWAISAGMTYQVKF